MSRIVVGGGVYGEDGLGLAFKLSSHNTLIMDFDMIPLMGNNDNSFTGKVIGDCNGEVGCF